MSQAPIEKPLSELHSKTLCGRCSIQATSMNFKKIKFLRVSTWLSSKNLLTYQFSRSQLKSLQSPRAITTSRTFGSSNLKTSRSATIYSENAVTCVVLLPSTQRKTRSRSHRRKSPAKSRLGVALEDE